MDSQPQAPVHPDLEPLSDDNTDVSNRPPAQREGLPPKYRMRAERHYVEAMAASSAGVPIRLVPVAQFAPVSPGTDAELDALIRSIRTHGIVQPLLVRKHDALYEVIAGKRRFAAAVAIGMPKVPCVVHQVDDATAAALATAENLKATRPGGSLRTAIGSQIANGVGAIADELDRLHRMVDLLVAAPEGFQHAVSLDLAAAQAWRTSWLAKTTAFVAAGRNREGRRGTISAAIYDVVEGFAPEGRLSGLRFDVRETGTPMLIDDDLVSIAVTGAILVTVAFMDKVARPVIAIDIESAESDGVRVQFTQRSAVVPRQTAQLFSAGGFSASGPVLVGLAAIAMAHVTAAYGGASELTIGEERGSSIQLTFRRV